MNRQIPLSTEPLVAVRASKSVVFDVCQLVGPRVFDCKETLVASRAFVFSPALSMHTCDVNIQMTLLSKTFGAFIAFVRFFLCMCQDVHGKVSRAPKRFGARQANPWFRRRIF